MSDALHRSVCALMREVAQTVVLPRFRALAAHEIEEKAPGDYVTVADRESELRLAEGLSRIDPDARVVGEEACATDPALLDGLNRGRLWLVDPIDGTGNFAGGHAPFGIMVALVEDGEVQAGWILDPLLDRVCHAVAGGGASIDGVRVQVTPSARTQPLVGIAPYFLDAAQQAELARRAEGRATLTPMPRCAAEQYPRLVLGANDAALFERTMPWDHAAGTLFLEEAGGVARRIDGRRYRVAQPRAGMIAAASPRLWDQTAAVLHARD